MKAYLQYASVYRALSIEHKHRQNLEIEILDRVPICDLIYAASIMGKTSIAVSHELIPLFKLDENLVDIMIDMGFIVSYYSLPGEEKAGFLIGW